MPRAIGYEDIRVQQPNANALIIAYHPGEKGPRAALEERDGCRGRELAAKKKALGPELVTARGAEQGRARD